MPQHSSDVFKVKQIVLFWCLQSPSCGNINVVQLPGNSCLVVRGTSDHGINLKLPVAGHIKSSSQYTQCRPGEDNVALSVSVTLLNQASKTAAQAGALSCTMVSWPTNIHPMRSRDLLQL